MNMLKKISDDARRVVIKKAIEGNPTKTAAARSLGILHRFPIGEEAQLTNTIIYEGPALLVQLMEE